MTQSLSDNIERFMEQQRKIIAQNSKERKQAEKLRKEMNERDYWKEYWLEADRMSDGSDEQPYEPELKEEESR